MSTVHWAKVESKRDVGWRSIDRFIDCIYHFCVVGRGTGSRRGSRWYKACARDHICIYTLAWWKGNKAVCHIHERKCVHTGYCTCAAFIHLVLFSNFFFVSNLNFCFYFSCHTRLCVLCTRMFLHYLNAYKNYSFSWRKMGKKKN